MIAKLKEIRYIDDRPVFDDEKRFALAFAKGGYEEEKKERENYRREQREKEEKRIKDFYNMIHPNENQEKNEKKKMSEEEREKKKLEFLKSIKNKKQNDIFNDNDIGIMPQVKKEESEREIKKNVINEEKKEDDDIPQLETVNILKNDINNNNDDELNIKVDEGVKINIKEQDLDELD